uniref:Putative secreted protein n=1 Tax=Anopheles triannulatus TaxID=58253 RepID=A0A2M4B2R4_9DIPT
MLGTDSPMVFLLPMGALLQHCPPAGSTVSPALRCASSLQAARVPAFVSAAPTIPDVSSPVLHELLPFVQVHLLESLD